MAAAISPTVGHEITAVNNGSFVTVCVKLPLKINSDGIWGNERSYFPMPLLEFQILLIFSVTMFFHFFFKHLKFPLFASQIIAGLVLGQSLKTNSKTLQLKRDIFNYGSQDIVAMISVMGYLLYVFLIGVKIDLGLIKRTGRKPFVIGIAALLIPSLISFLVVSVFKQSGNDNEGIAKVQYIAGRQSSTSFAIVACLLDHLQFLTSEVGRLGLSCALISDLVNLSYAIVAILFKPVSQEDDFLCDNFATFATTIGCILIVAFIFRPAMVWLAKNTPHGRPVNNVYISAIVILVLMSGVIADSLQQPTFIGPFILGLAVPEGPPLGVDLVNKLEAIVSSVLLPLFVTLAAIKVDLSFINHHSILYIESIMVLMAETGGRIAACFSCCLVFGMAVRDAFVLALIMSSKGIVELSICFFFYDNQLIDNQTFALLIAYILIISIFVPIMVRYSYDPSRKYVGYQRSNVFSLRGNAELRILGCVHTPNDVLVLTNLVDTACPTEESPIQLYALHLMELVGRVAPVFISHRLDDRKNSSERSLSSQIIQMLYRYERSCNEGDVAVLVELFTAIASMKLIHEDVCSLALDKLTSIIILPFHQKWSREGFLELDENFIRAVNCNILDWAPCSVGILIDRGHFIGHSRALLLRIAMVFIGGRDDREALSFARRMAKDLSGTDLTVIRLVSEGDHQPWDKILDSEMLKEVKERIVEKKADEGAQTAAVVRAIVKEYDVIVVGRRYGVESQQTLGLMEWNEFPELGSVGDLLASYEFNPRASVMVIQQQQLNIDEIK